MFPHIRHLFFNRYTYEQLQIQLLYNNYYSNSIVIIQIKINLTLNYIHLLLYYLLLKVIWKE